MEELKRTQYSLKETSELTGYSTDDILDFGGSKQIEIFLFIPSQLRGQKIKKIIDNEKRYRAEPVGKDNALLGMIFPLNLLEIEKIKKGIPIESLRDSSEKDIFYVPTEPVHFNIDDMYLFPDSIETLLQSRTGSKVTAKILTNVFDTKNIAHCPELALAIRAWNAIYSKGEFDPARGNKENIEAWLKRQQPPKIKGDVFERITKMINLDRRDGSGGNEKWHKIKEMYYPTP